MFSFIEDIEGSIQTLRSIVPQGRFGSVDQEFIVYRRIWTLFRSDQRESRSHNPQSGSEPGIIKQANRIKSGRMKRSSLRDNDLHGNHLLGIAEPANRLLIISVGYVCCPGIPSLGVLWVVPRAKLDCESGTRSSGSIR
ncbi:hypothetical protein NPIL_13351 [Nephila pilipes]|uniref:Uncharacterized protein n=1 Tax=Nephila pilipes TaxID=299642 RepID=A0A8X6PAU6_NEPPI|nr:hypothetical protein NPIL_13351 [Nephila pilipes]